MNRLLFACQWMVFSAFLIIGIVYLDNLKSYSDINVLAGTLEWFIGLIFMELLILFDIYEEKRRMEEKNEKA